jgi:L-alanine-DL-glutamate epimerase-like enolase superfamily enzyme
MARIARVEAFKVDLPVIKPFVFASGTAGAAGDTAAVVFVKVTDEDGNAGWGEARASPSWSYETPETILSTIESYLGPALLGLAVTDRWGLHERMRGVIGLGPSTGQPLAKAALDIALHDLCARAAGQTLRAFLGGANERDEIELSYTLTAHEAAAAREDVAEGRAAGFRHFNFKVAVEPATDLAVAAAVREAAGTEAFVWADANQGLSLRQARTVAAGLADAGSDVLEQPLPADALHSMGALRASTTLPLALDESTVSPADFFGAAAAGVVDYLVVKVTRSGGLWPTWQQIAVSEAAGLGLLVSGLTDSMVTKLAACQIAAAVGFAGPAGLNGSQFMDDSAFFPDKGDAESGGVVRLGTRPGIGIEPDEAELRRVTGLTAVVA